MGPMPLLQAPIVGIFSQEGHNGRRDKDNTKKTNAETTRRLGFFFFAPIARLGADAETNQRRQVTSEDSVE